MLSLISLLISVSFAKLEYQSTQLITKDLEQMSELFQNKTKLAKKDADNQNEYYKEAVTLLFSRPNEDGLIDTVFNNVKYSWADEGLYSIIFKAVTREAIDEIKNEKASLKDRVTYWVILENVMSEFKPKLNSKDALAQEIFSQIRDANIEISSKLKNERKLTSMKEAASPSKVAEKIYPATVNKASKK